jgi:hypothetical protein
MSINSNLGTALVMESPVYGLEDKATFSFGLGVDGIKDKSVNILKGCELKFKFD